MWISPSVSTTGLTGLGGGFAQGEFLARATLSDDLRWLTPSRFGHLRSTFHPGAPFDEQAHAYAHLLDHLGLRRVVVAFSHGGPSALRWVFQRDWRY